jgi:hypothetical protein
MWELARIGRLRTDRGGGRGKDVSVSFKAEQMCSAVGGEDLAQQENHLGASLEKKLGKSHTGFL